MGNLLELKESILAELAATSEEELNSTDDADTEGETIDVAEETEEQQALSETIDQLTEELDEARKERDELSVELNETKRQLQTTVEKLSQLLSLLGNGPSENSAETSTTTPDGVTEEVDELTTTINTLTQENQALTEKIAEEKAKSLKYLASRVVDLKMFLGDIKESDRDKKLDEYSARSEESLQDAITDLEDRMTSWTPAKQIEKIKNPSLADNTESYVTETTIQDTDEEQEEKNHTDALVYKALRSLLSKKSE